MSENTPGPGNIPQTPVQPKKFNIGKMIEKRELASFIFQICDGLSAKSVSSDQRLRYANMSAMFNGVLVGYDDWFQELGINEAVFKMVAKAIDYESLKKKAAEIVEANIPSQVLVVPDASSVRTVAAIKQMFDEKIRRG